MREITLNKKPVEVLKVNVGDESYSVPLASSLPFSDVKALSEIKSKDQIAQLDFMMAFFTRYIPKEVVDQITGADLGDLFHAWSEASEEANGTPLGE